MFGDGGSDSLGSLNKQLLRKICTYTNLQTIAGGIESQIKNLSNFREIKLTYFKGCIVLVYFE